MKAYTRVLCGKLVVSRFFEASVCITLLLADFSRLLFVLCYMECLCHPYIESLPTL